MNGCVWPCSNVAQKKPSSSHYLRTQPGRRSSKHPPQLSSPPAIPPPSHRPAEGRATTFRHTGPTLRARRAELGPLPHGVRDGVDQVHPQLQSTTRALRQQPAASDHKANNRYSDPRRSLCRTKETERHKEGDKERSLGRTVASSRSRVLTMSVTSGVSTSNCRGSSDEASPPDTRRAWALCRGIVPSFFPESRPCVCHAQRLPFRRLSS